jgi:hypothetical protein
MSNKTQQRAWVLHGMVFRYQAASCGCLQGRQNEDRQEIAIKVACYLLTDDINGQELGRLYCLCQTWRYVQQRHNFRCLVARTPTKGCLTKTSSIT